LDDNRALPAPQPSGDAKSPATVDVLAPERVIDALQRAQGDFNVASELLGRLVTVADIKRVAVSDKSVFTALQAIYKIDTLQNLAEVTKLLGLEVRNRLDKIPADQLVKSYSLMVERLQDVSEGRGKGSLGGVTVNQNNLQIDALIEQLPPGVRKMVIEAIGQPIDIDPD
jgi:hypothetical protein